MTNKHLLIVSVSALLVLGLGACGGGEGSGEGSGGGASGQITVDGSSTVFPFAQAAAEQFQIENPDVRVTVGQSGTGGGFEKFCSGEIEIATASRPIKDDEEVPVCEENGISYKQVQVASDGIAVVTNPSLEIDCLTTEQLKRLWATDEVSNYSELGPEFPDQDVSLYGPGTDSGTFDFFTEEINGESGVTRKDYQPSEDDNVLVQGVTGDEGGLGYFGFSYYGQNQDRLNLVGIDSGDGCVKPSLENIQAGEYTPLGRPIFMYPSEQSLQKPEVKAFMDFIVENYEGIAEAAEIVPMSAEAAQESKATLGG